MSFEILRTNEFSKHLKALGKKYLSIQMDYSSLLDMLSANPTAGIPLSKSCYKISIKISSKHSGKSGGARVITYVKVEKKRITLLDIYDKTDKDTISEKELINLIKKSDV